MEKNSKKKFTDDLIDIVKNDPPCYVRDAVQGLSTLPSCPCHEGNRCQPYKDRNRFHRRFAELQMELQLEPTFDAVKDACNREKIIKILKPEFADSFWWKHNVVE